MTLAAVEAMYAGEVGDAYLRRNKGLAMKRYAFWREVAALTDPESVLEVGVGAGENLHAFLPHTPTIVGVDVNPTAITETKQTTCGIASGVVASAGALPFPDASFDLVVTCGLLIHVPRAALEAVLSELVRVARRYVLTAEYEWPHEVHIPWRGLDNVLWKRPHSLLLWQLHPALQPIERWVLGHDQGFDTVDAALFAVGGANGR